MAMEHILGYFYAIFGGCIIQTGSLMQKSVINSIPVEEREAPGYMKILVKKPVWLLGMTFTMAGGAVFFMLAQKIIGGALVPGLAASGYIILIIGSVTIIHEKLTTKEIIAIVFMIAGITLIGLSSLVITDDEAQMAFSSNRAFQWRIIIFSIILVAIWIVTMVLGRKQTNLTVFSLSTGIPFAIGNIWFQPMLITIVQLFSNETWVTVTFVISALFVGGVNIAGLVQVQHNLKMGNASKIIPIQQIPQQIVPVLLYFVVFQKEPEISKVIFSILGILIIILCGFVLSQKQAQLDEIK